MIRSLLVSFIGLTLAFSSIIVTNDDDWMGGGQSLIGEEKWRALLTHIYDCRFATVQHVLNAYDSTLKSGVEPAYTKSCHTGCEIPTRVLISNSKVSVLGSQLHFFPPTK